MGRFSRTTCPSGAPRNRDPNRCPDESLIPKALHWCQILLVTAAAPVLHHYRCCKQHLPGWTGGYDGASRIVEATVTRRRRLSSPEPDTAIWNMTAQIVHAGYPLIFESPVFVLPLAIHIVCVPHDHDLFVTAVLRPAIGISTGS